MKRTTTLTSLALAAAVAALLPGCSTNTQGDSAAPVFLVGEFTELPLEKLLTDATPLQFKTTTLTNTVKRTGVTTLTFLDVQVDTATVRWTRVDGGTVASPTQTFGVGVVVPANGTSTLSNYPYMSAAELLLPPLDQLYPFNGGIDRETGKSEIIQLGHVTWSGHTISGQAVVSGEATFNMFFTYNGVSVRSGGKLVR
ncbi:MAG TPA: hypothetical protein VMV60_04830 [Thermoanaerobaculia bacterium]|nr:hypothetical protein [Thermoanaerobaculia bacterium]